MASSRRKHLQLRLLFASFDQISYNHKNQ